MSLDIPFRGSLFAHDYLHESITRLDDWRDIDAAAFEAAVGGVFARFPMAGSPNESQTEDDLIWPVLAHLGWTESLRQQNLSALGRQDVPDGLLFQDAAAKDRANGFTEEWRRYELGLAVVESKRWRRPLDRQSDRRGEETAPSTQMLRYLRRVDDLTTGALRWGILTNGARWRLYYQGARSVLLQRLGSRARVRWVDLATRPIRTPCGSAASDRPRRPSPSTAPVPCGAHASSRYRGRSATPW